LAPGVGSARFLLSRPDRHIDLMTVRIAQHYAIAVDPYDDPRSNRVPRRYDVASHDGQATVA
jgi:hypothetical protein